MAEETAPDMAGVDRGVAFSVDTQRTCLQREFFAHFDFDTMAELIRAISEMRVGVDSIARSRDIRSQLYSGWVYWFLFLRGFLECVEAGELQDENVYLQYMVRYYAPRRHDPGVVETFREPERAKERIMHRFDVLLDFASAQSEGRQEVTALEPIVVYERMPMPQYPLRVYPVDSVDSLGGALVDGWHRLFGAKLMGITSIPGLVVRQPDGSES